MNKSLTTKDSLQFHYDEISDVLYAIVGKKRNTVSKEKGNGITLRLDPITNEIVGFIIIDYKQRREKKLLKAIPSFEKVALPIY
ncbi:MAG: hypothetical protein AB1521_04735 [Bacteroidota bacterium]